MTSKLREQWTEVKEGDSAFNAEMKQIQDKFPEYGNVAENVVTEVTQDVFDIEITNPITYLQERDQLLRTISDLGEKISDETRTVLLARVEQTQGEIAEKARKDKRIADLIYEYGKNKVLSDIKPDDDINAKSLQSKVWGYINKPLSGNKPDDMLPVYFVKKEDLPTHDYSSKLNTDIAVMTLKNSASETGKLQIRDEEGNFKVIDHLSKPSNISKWFVHNEKGTIQYLLSEESKLSEQQKMDLIEGIKIGNLIDISTVSSLAELEQRINEVIDKNNLNEDQFSYHVRSKSIKEGVITSIITQNLEATIIESLKGNTQNLFTLKRLYDQLPQGLIKINLENIIKQGPKADNFAGKHLLQFLNGITQELDHTQQRELEKLQKEFRSDYLQEVQLNNLGVYLPLSRLRDAFSPLDCFNKQEHGQLTARKIESIGIEYLLKNRPLNSASEAYPSEKDLDLLQTLSARREISISDLARSPKATMEALNKKDFTPQMKKLFGMLAIGYMGVVRTDNHVNDVTQVAEWAGLSVEEVAHGHNTYALIIATEQELYLGNSSFTYNSKVMDYIAGVRANAKKPFIFESSKLGEIASVQQIKIAQGDSFRFGQLNESVPYNKVFDDVATIKKYREELKALTRLHAPDTLTGPLQSRLLTSTEFTKPEVVTPQNLIQLTDKDLPTDLASIERNVIESDSIKEINSNLEILKTLTDYSEKLATVEYTKAEVEKEIEELNKVLAENIKSGVTRNTSPLDLFKKVSEIKAEYQNLIEDRIRSMRDTINKEVEDISTPINRLSTTLEKAIVAFIPDSGVLQFEINSGGTQPRWTIDLLDLNNMDGVALNRLLTCFTAKIDTQRLSTVRNSLEQTANSIKSPEKLGVTPQKDVRETLDSLSMERLRSKLLTRIMEVYAKRKQTLGEFKSSDPTLIHLNKLLSSQNNNGKKEN